ncbi:hypothetical protein SK128_004007 [Halocaridina rubra]|uniref:NACHT domain-containing protein n=1 Tax=Halocaridina rubra TaxID=373956 RepID=A0AAN8X2U0_HALRR
MASNNNSLSQSSQQTLTKNRENFLHLVILIDQEARSILKTIFEMGTSSKRSSETLKEYLMRDKGMTNSLYRKIFNNTQRKQIDSDPSCCHFDVSLLYSAIQRSCDGLAPPEHQDWLTDGKFENLLKKVKDIRNDIFHGIMTIQTSEYVQKIERIRTLLIDCIKQSGEKYSKSDLWIKNTTDDMNVRINQIRDEPLSPMSLEIYENLPLFTELQKTLTSKGIKDLINLFENMVIINPTSAIVGHEFKLRVEEVYTTPMIFHARRGLVNVPLALCDILHYVHQMQSRDSVSTAQIILIEGSGGVGKTTLLKLIGHAWLSYQKGTSSKVSSSCEIKGVGKYRFVIPFKFRNRSISSFSNLISSIMPTARQSFQNKNHLRDCVVSVPIIILLDGFDEMNEESKKVLYDILSSANLEHIIIICTSRPEKIKEFYRMVNNEMNIIHLKIKGIPERSVEKFLSRYHDALKNRGQSKDDSKLLIKYIRSKTGHLKSVFSFPLYAANFAVLWTFASDKLSNICSELEFLIELDRVTIEKLIERLGSHPSTMSLEEDVLRKKVKNFVAYLHKAAFFALHHNSTILREDEKHDLVQCCESLALPVHEVMGTYLIQENTWSSTDMEIELKFPHKSIQDFYAALYISDKLKCKKKPLDIASILKNFSDILSGSQLPFQQQNQILGNNLDMLLNCQKDLRASVNERDVLVDALTSELHTEMKYLDMNTFQNMLVLLTGFLFHSEYNADYNIAEQSILLLKQSGIDSREEWIRVINIVKCHDIFVTAIAKEPSNMGDTINISGSDVSAYSALLTKVKPNNISLSVSEDPSTVPFLEELILIIANHQCFVSLCCLEYLFRHPNKSLEEAALMQALRQLMDRCHIETCVIPYSEGMRLPSGDRIPAFSVSTHKDYNNLCEELYKNQHKIKYLRLSLSIGIKASQVVKPLPPWFSGKVDLYLPDTDSEHDIESVASLISSVMPSSG